MTFLQAFQHGSDGRPRHGIAGRGEYSRMESLNFRLFQKTGACFFYGVREKIWGGWLFQYCAAAIENENRSKMG